MRGVGVPQRVDVSAFDDARLLPSTVDGGKAHPIDRNAHLAENPANFFTGQDDRQLLLTWRTEKPQRGPIAVKRLLVEKLDTTQGDGRRRSRHLFLVGQIQEILTQL